MEREKAKKGAEKSANVAKIKVTRIFLASEKHQVTSIAKIARITNVTRLKTKKEKRPRKAPKSPKMWKKSQK